MKIINVPISNAKTALSQVLDTSFRHIDDQSENGFIHKVNYLAAISSLFTYSFSDAS